MQVEDRNRVPGCACLAIHPSSATSHAKRVSQRADALNYHVYSGPVRSDHIGSRSIPSVVRGRVGFTVTHVAASAGCRPAP